MKRIDLKMDKSSTYQNIITILLEEYAAIPPSYPTTLRDELIIETQRRHCNSGCVFFFIDFERLGLAGNF